MSSVPVAGGQFCDLRVARRPGTEEARVKPMAWVSGALWPPLYICAGRTGPGYLVRLIRPQGKAAMRTSECGSGEQAALASATVKATRASTAPVLDYAPSRAAMPERDLMSNRRSTEHMILDGFIWHSISCACNSCVRNDNKFMVTLNRPDFRPYA